MASERLSASERRALGQAVAAGYSESEHTLNGALLIAAVEAILAGHTQAARAEGGIAALEALAPLLKPLGVVIHRSVIDGTLSVHTEPNDAAGYVLDHFACAAALRSQGAEGAGDGEGP